MNLQDMLKDVMPSIQENQTDVVHYTLTKDIFQNMLEAGVPREEAFSNALSVSDWFTESYMKHKEPQPND